VQQDDILPAFAAILARFAKMHRAVVTRDLRLQADLGIDSLSMIDLACAAEDAFGIRLPDEDIERFRTVGDAVDYIERARPAV
jgi:acyl carrier protein